MAALGSAQSAPDERTPLIRDPENAEIGESTLSEDEVQPQSHISTGITYRLYLSHFLSTWNSRVFEFGAVLYLATIYPGTLLPMSAYALSRGLVAIIFSSAVGYYIDKGNRLQVVRVSIGRLLEDTAFLLTSLTFNSVATTCGGCIVCDLLFAGNWPSHDTSGQHLLAGESYTSGLY